MKKIRHTTPQIIEKLRQADVALGKGQKVPDICKTLEITEQTYYRWRQKYGGMAPEMAKLRYVAGTRWGTRKYLDMSRLAEHQAESATSNIWTEIGSASGTHSVN